MTPSRLALPIPDDLIERVAERAAEIVLLRLSVEERQEHSPYLTIPEAASLLRCSRQRIDDLLSQGRLTRRKDGSRTLISRAEIARYIGDGERR